jgi:hypothetical protein
MEVLRFDFNGSSGEFKRTPQGFLRVNAFLTKTGIFQYENGREYRSDDEVFRADSLESLKGAPVTDLHPSEKGADSFLTPANAKQHMIGIAEGVEREGPYLKGSLLIFHEDAIKAIESGDRKEISLGYKCRLEPVAGFINGEAYDAIQRDIVVNHVAIGPKGWGRAGADCAIRVGSQITSQGKSMNETLRLDGVDIALTRENITTVFNEQKRQFEELRGRFDAMGLELEKEKAARAALENPHVIDAKVSARIKLVERCKKFLGDDEVFDGKTDDELKILSIKKINPDIDFSDKDPSYIDGMFEALSQSISRNDSLSSTRQAIVNAKNNSNPHQAYEAWIEHSSKLWSLPLAGSSR